MCLTVWTDRTNFNLLMKASDTESFMMIAKEDIVAYKLLDKVRVKGKVKYLSPHKDYEYKKGYHYYQKGKSPFTYTFGYTCFKVNEGLHVYRTLHDAYCCMNHGNNVVVKMIIPKGAKYFANGSERASSALIFPARGKVFTKIEAMREMKKIIDEAAKATVKGSFLHEVV